jgi:hypothetical protein
MNKHNEELKDVTIKMNDLRLLINKINEDHSNNIITNTEAILLFNSLYNEFNIIDQRAKTITKLIERQTDINNILNDN